MQKLSGILLLAMTLIALILANSGLSDSYFDFLHTPFGFRFGFFQLLKPFEHWVNDGLMAIFFFVVGLEIKKEFLQGTLATRKSAALPMLAALGGMLAPAFIYLIFNRTQPTSSGWGIPMATDIAFALGVLALLGNRIPPAIKIFLMALAIVDDLGAVLVIAFFYTAELSFVALAWAALGLGIIVLLNYWIVGWRFIYIILGILVWYAFFKSGVHATIAGVLLGLVTPIKPRLSKDDLRREAFDILRRGDDQHLAQLPAVANKAVSPADAWIHVLHPWVSFFIMPLFALTNAGVRLENFSFSQFVAAPVSLGIFFGLFVGKPLGIFLFSWLGCKLGWAERPPHIKWRQILGAATLGGIGFTMALFIAHLSLTDIIALDFAKLAILIASLASAIAGTLILVAKP